MTRRTSSPPFRFPSRRRPRHLAITLLRTANTEFMRTWADPPSASSAFVSVFGAFTNGGGRLIAAPAASLRGSALSPAMPRSGHAVPAFERARSVDFRRSASERETQDADAAVAPICGDPGPSNCLRVGGSATRYVLRVSERAKPEGACVGPRPFGSTQRGSFLEQGALQSVSRLSIDVLGQAVQPACRNVSAVCRHRTGHSCRSVQGEL